MSDLARALEMVEKATGPLEKPDAEDIADQIWPEFEGLAWAHTVIALQGTLDSLGAVVALIEREMPAAWWETGGGDSQRYDVPYAAVICGPEFNTRRHETRCATPALSLFAAFLRAKIAEEQP